MADKKDILHQILSKLDEQGSDIKALREEVATVKGDMTLLKRGQETLTLQVELINANQQRAEKQSERDHEEIVERLVTIADITGKEHRALEKRVDRIEKHLDLPPIE